MIDFDMVSFCGKKLCQREFLSTIFVSLKIIENNLNIKVNLLTLEQNAVRYLAKYSERLTLITLCRNSVDNNIEIKSLICSLLNMINLISSSNFFFFIYI